MVSAINPALPITGTPTTQSVRDNFQTTSNEITALQAAVLALQSGGPFLPLIGGAVTGATSFAAAVTITGNTAVPSPLGGNTYLQITGANGTTPRISLDAFGAVATIVYRTAGGTAAAPSKITGGGPLGVLGFTGHDGVAYSVPNQAQMAVWSDGAAGWSATNHPTKFTWATTPVNSITMTEVMRLTAAGHLLIGTITDGSIMLDVNGSARVSGALTTSLATKTGTAYTLAATDYSLILNPSGTFILTLPTAASSTGRQLLLKLIAAFAVNSASANVVPLIGGAATSAIMPATAGKFCALQSDGTSWQITSAN